ncbi:MAG: 50S ribosomal protein L23 [Bacilli bacterium]|jgi:large subunit ribosomal protein L23
MILEIIKGPIVTEKATELKNNQGKYIFKVEEKANKIQIKQAIEKRFAVKVKEINVLNVKPKTKRVGRYVGKTNKYKKAIVTLVEGNQIDM